MVESTWEKRSGIPGFLKWLFIVLPLASAAGIMFFNNRETSRGSAEPGTCAPQKESSAAGHPAPLSDNQPAGARSVTGAGPVSLVKRPAPGTDSVDIGSVTCRVSGRSDIRARIAITVYCDGQMKNEVLLKRDALAAVSGKALRSADIQAAKTEGVKSVLLKSMNGLFDRPAVLGIDLRSCAIEKVSPQ